MVHQKFNDLVLLPIFETKGIDGSSMNFYVNRDVQHEWNLSDGELLLIAEKNTFDVKNLNFRTMAEVLSESMGVPIELIGDTSPGMNIYVLSNMDNRFGSTAIASKQFQHEIHEKLQSNYFIIGSSIHECLIIPEDTIDDPADLAYMAKSINDDSSVMSKEEILSNSIYYYDGTKVSIANTKQELLELKSEQKVLDVSIDRHI